MSSTNYLTEDSINPPNQQFICISFFNKKHVKQVIDNNNEYIQDEESKESYSDENNVLAIKFRGAFSTQEQAAAHAHKLQSIDKNHSV